MQKEDRNHIVEVIKHAMHYVAVFVKVLAVLILLLLISCTLPKGNTKQNIKESYTQFVDTKQNCQWLIPSKDGTMIDIYADSIWMNMVYYMDTEHPIKSMMQGNYYDDPYSDKTIQEQQSQAIAQNEKANMTYERYWHGSMIYLKPLFAVFSINGVRIVQYLILGILMSIVGYLLVIRKEWRLLISFFAGLFATGIYIVPYGLEYFNVFAIVISLCIYILMSKKKSIQEYYSLFVVAGVTVAFFDFLTVEILTLLMPLAFLFCLYKEEIAGVTIRKNIVYTVKCALLWCGSYGLTFLTKWFLAGGILNKNILSVALYHAKERAVQEVDMPLARQWLLGLQRNIRNVFPLSHVDTVGQLINIMLLILFLFIVLYICFGYKPDGVQRRSACLLLLLGIVPFVRYSVLINHAYLHYFFTYRSLSVSVMAICYVALLHMNGKKTKRCRR